MYTNLFSNGNEKFSVNTWKNRSLMETTLARILFGYFIDIQPTHIQTCWSSKIHKLARKTTIIKIKFPIKKIALSSLIFYVYDIISIYNHQFSFFNKTQQKLCCDVRILVDNIWFAEICFRSENFIKWLSKHHFNLNVSLFYFLPFIFLT